MQYNYSEKKEVRQEVRRINHKKFVAFKYGRFAAEATEEVVNLFLSRFWNKYSAQKEKDGHKFEIILCFLLGMILDEAKNFGLNLKFKFSPWLDMHEKKDLVINGKGFQLKWDWDSNSPELTLTFLYCERQDICLYCRKPEIYENGKVFNVSCQEMFEDLFQEAGLNKQLIKKFFDESLAMTSVEEGWSWFLEKVDRKVDLNKKY